MSSMLRTLRRSVKRRDLQYADRNIKSFGFGDRKKRRKEARRKLA